MSPTCFPVSKARSTPLAQMFSIAVAAMDSCWMITPPRSKIMKALSQMRVSSSGTKTLRVMSLSPQRILLDGPRAPADVVLLRHGGFPMRQTRLLTLADKHDNRWWFVSTHATNQMRKTMKGGMAALMVWTISCYLYISTLWDHDPLLWAKQSRIIKTTCNIANRHANESE